LPLRLVRAGEFQLIAHLRLLKLLVAAQSGVEHIQKQLGFR
jgi:hypothetical protein